MNPNILVLKGQGFLIRFLHYIPLIEPFKKNLYSTLLATLKGTLRYPLVPTLSGLEDGKLRASSWAFVRIPAEAAGWMQDKLLGLAYLGLIFFGLNFNGLGCIGFKREGLGIGQHNDKGVHSSWF